MKLSKWLIATFMNLMIAFTLSVSPVASEFARAQTANAETQQFIDNVNQQKSANEAVSARGEKKKPSYIEMMVFIALALAIVTSPIPKRTMRSKKDCPSQFSGPVNIILMKLGAIATLISEAITYKQYNDKAKEIRSLANYEGNKTEGKDNVQTGSSNTELLNQDDMYDTYLSLFKGQKKVMETKKNIYTALTAANAVALALETVVTATCTGTCLARHSKYQTVDKTLTTAATTWNTSFLTLTAAIHTALTTSLGATTAQPACVAGLGLLSPSLAAVASYESSYAAYVAAKEAGVSAFMAKGVAEGTATHAKQAKDAATFISAFKTVLSGLTGIDVPEMPSIDAFDLVEKANMTTNETAAISFSTATLTPMLTNAGAMTALRTALPTELGTAAACCAATCATAIGPQAVVYGPLCATCSAAIATASASYATFEPLIQAGQGVVKGIQGGKKAANAAIEASDKAMDASITAAQSSVSVVMSQATAGLGKIFSGALFNPASVATDAAATSAQAASGTAKEAAGKVAGEMTQQLGIAVQDKTMEQMTQQLAALKGEAQQQAVGIATPFLAAFDGLLDDKHTCCGSFARLTLPPSKRIPLPTGALSLAKQTDIMPPKGTFTADAGTRKMLEDAMVSLYKNMRYEDAIDGAKEGYELGNTFKNQLVLASTIEKLDAIERIKSVDDIHFDEEEQGIIINILAKLNQNIGISDAHAMAEGFLGGLGMKAIAGVNAVIKAVKKIYFAGVKAPLNRIVFLGLLAAFNGVQISRADKVVDEIDGHIKILEEYQKAAKETNNTGQETTLGAAAVLTPTLANIDLSSKPVETCVSVSTSSASSSACPGKVADREAFTAKRSFSAQLGGSDFSGAFDYLSSNVLAAGVDGANGGQFSAAQVGQFGNISKAMREKMLKATAELKKANGKQSANIDDLVNNALRDLASVGPHLSSLPSHSPFGGAGSAIPAPSLADDAAKAEDIGIPQASAAPVAAIPSFDIPTDNAIDLGLGTEPEAAIPESTDPGTLSDNLEKYEVENNDIAQNGGASIFEILSKRYLLSYPKVLETNTPTPEAAPAKEAAPVEPVKQ